MKDGSRSDQLREKLRGWLPKTQDPLKRALVSALVALLSAFGTALAQGTWAIVAGAVGALAVVAFLFVAVSAAVWHVGELEGVGFTQVRDGDAKDRKLAQYEREVRVELTEAHSKPVDRATHHARAESRLERARKHIQSGRSSSIGLLVLRDQDGADYRIPILTAGSLDQSLLRNPAELADWLDGLGAQKYEARMVVHGRVLHCVGVSPDLGSWIDNHDKFEIQRTATHLQGLLEAPAQADEVPGEVAS